MEIEELLNEMIAFKKLHPTLTNDEILKMFNIKSMINLTNEIRWAFNR